MKKLLVLLLLAFLGCSTLPQEDRAYLVKMKKMDTGSYAVGVAYKSIDYINEQGRARAEKELREYTPIDDGTSGYLSLQVQSSTITGANGKNWLFIVLDSEGQEVARKKGTPGVSSNLNYGNFTSFHVLDVPAGVSFPITVRIISALSKSYSEYIISPRGSGIR